MGYIIGIIVIGIIVFVISTGMKGMKDIKHVEKSGGLLLKYKYLIENLKSGNSQMIINEHNSNNVEIIYSSYFIDGSVSFKLTEMSKFLMVRYTTKDNVTGVQRLAWKFSEKMNQQEMFETISTELLFNSLGKTKGKVQKIYEEDLTIEIYEEKTKE